MLGFIAENLRDGLTETVQWHELDAELARGVQLIDVRTPAEYARGHGRRCDQHPGRRAARAPRRGGSTTSIVHCQVGLRGYLAARMLAQHGRRVRNLDGGYRTWARV